MTRLKMLLPGEVTQKGEINYHDVNLIVLFTTNVFFSIYETDTMFWNIIDNFFLTPPPMPYCIKSNQKEHRLEH